MTDIYQWSLSPSSNGSSDAGINMAEGMPPAALNDGIRTVMARVAAFIDDIGGVNTVGGTANAITVSLASAFTTHNTGKMLAFKAASTNTGSVTLSVNSIGAKAVRKVTLAGEEALAAGDIQVGGIYFVIYDAAAASGSGAWMLLSMPQISGTMQITGGSPTLTMTDTDTGGDVVLSAANGSGSATLAADANNEVAGSTITFTIDGVEAGRLSAAGNVAAEFTDTSNTRVRVTSTKNDSAWSTGDVIGAFEIYSADGSGPGAGVRASIRCVTENTIASQNALSIRNASSSSLTQEVARFASTGYVSMQGVYDQTTANAANVNVSASGALARSTSARKYKDNVLPVPEALVDAFLGLQAVTYTSKCASDDPARVQVGLIADEAHAAGLQSLVTYDPDGEVEGFAYERTTALLLEAVKALRSQVTHLTARLNAAGI